MSTLSRRHWRELICRTLDRTDPARLRWVQEHPQHDAILNELVTEAIDLWCQAMAAREDPNWGPDPWTRVGLDELEELIVNRTLEIPELWEELDETYPRTPKAEKPDPFGPMPLDLIPATGPTRPRSPRPR